LEVSDKGLIIQCSCTNLSWEVTGDIISRGIRSHHYEYNVSGEFLAKRLLISVVELEIMSGFQYEAGQNPVI
jgi:hypothetical protein